MIVVDINAISYFLLGREKTIIIKGLGKKVCVDNVCMVWYLFKVMRGRRAYGNES